MAMRNNRKRNFIQGAIKHPGALKEAAKRAGMTIAAYCGQSNLDTHGKQMCNLYRTLKKLGKKKKK